MNDYSTKCDKPTTRIALAAAALEVAGYNALAGELLGCGDLKRPGAVVFCDRCGYAKAIVYTCHSRLCSECEKRAQAQRFLKYLPVILASKQRKQFGYNFKHVTITTDILLTDENVVAASSAAWRIARKALDLVLFGKLYRAKLLTDDEIRRGQSNWKLQHIGAVAGGEFGGLGYRFHMHFLMYSPFIDHGELTAALTRLSGGKWSVNWITPVTDIESGAAEVILKYATKLSELPVELFPALQAAITGQRRIRCYGAWFGVPDSDDELCGCPECANKLRHEQIPSQLEWEMLLKHGVDAWYTWRHADSLLDLIHGNNSRETARGTPHWNTPKLL